MYIVNVEGDNPFIASSIKALTKAMKELHGGKELDKGVLANGTYRVTWITNIFQELRVVADKTEVYK